MLLLPTSSSWEQWQDLTVPFGAYKDFGFWQQAADYSCLANTSQQSTSLLPASSAVEEKMVVAKCMSVEDSSRKRETTLLKSLKE